MSRKIINDNGILRGIENKEDTVIIVDKEDKMIDQYNEKPLLTFDAEPEHFGKFGVASLVDLVRPHITKPQHYVDKNPWNVVRDFDLPFLEGNVIRYIIRQTNKKDKPEERINDLKKALNYILEIMKNIEEEDEEEKEILNREQVTLKLMHIEQEFLYGGIVNDEEYTKRKDILRELYKEKTDEESIKCLEEFINDRNSIDEDYDYEEEKE
jgi:hypothetical protein